MEHEPMTPEHEHGHDPEFEQALRSAAAAARQWWASKRPVDWTVAQHAQGPTVNCSTSEEQQLGKACANLRMTAMKLWPEAHK